MVTLCFIEEGTPYVIMEVSCKTFRFIQKKRIVTPLFLHNVKGKWGAGGGEWS